MGRLRAALAILIKPNDTLLYPEPQERFRGRARVQSSAGVNSVAVLAGVIFLVILVGAWVFTGFGVFRTTSDTSDVPIPPPPVVHPRPGSSGVTGFPRQYETHEPPKSPAPEPEAPKPEPPKPMLAAATMTTNGHSPSLTAIQELTLAMTEMAKNMNRIEGKVDQMGKASKTPAVTGSVPSPGQPTKVKSAEQKEKEAIERRRSGPYWSEKKRDKEGTSYYRRGKLGEYRLAAGWNIPIILDDEASNQSPGVYKFTVRQAVMDSATGEREVLAQYSYGLLRVTGGQLFGDVELPASLVALNLPDGTPVKMGENSVGDVGGRSGFRDQVDHRVWNIILTTIVRSGLLIGGAGAIGGTSGDIGDRAGAAVVGEGVRETANQVQQFANTSPIHTVRPGYLGNLKVITPVDLGMLHAIR